MEKKGIVFDIQRFSIHDGPGIRTTVFLKGCPLRCKWCHNPESWESKPQLMFYKDRCINCQECVASCINQVHSVEQGKHVVDFTLCKGIGSCVEHCAYGALKISGSKMTAQEILQEVNADRSFYQNSGGRLTVSGGEPMMQFEFLKDLLEQAKAAGIHTCMETSGFAPQEKFAKICRLIDLFLFDIKHMNHQAHQKYTGVTNQLIHSNLDYLYQKGARILLRCPVIPGINDTQEHIAGIAELTKKYPDLVGVEILPYHDMGKGKWAEIGKEYTLTELKNMEEIQKKRLLQRFVEAGCKKVII